LRYSQVGFWGRATIIVIFTSVSSLELFFSAVLLDREHRRNPNLKIGYKSTLLSRGERVQKSAEIVRKPGTGFDEN
jgi:hypothetical protein